ncbi:hypothetical protein GDO78_015406 [Eleutherodactylus coqui]|uniref:Ig-like domain-containing protein n=1 Tax=Eleutherodactylus coqui TaxID=57060 RepID=A0A8J6E8K4_ELECQ|nr:hypothetical protein GDO78_015406 [Eleutherodactylus coqui]
MSCFFLLLSLVLYCAYASAQFTVTQDASVSASPGETVRLTCSRSGGSVTSSNYPAWFYQTPGSPPKLLVYNTGTTASGISDRFSGSISEGLAILSISRVQSTDEGSYHCFLYSGGGGTYTVVYGDEEHVQIPPGCPT